MGIPLAVAVGVVGAVAVIVLARTKALNRSREERTRGLGLDAPR